MSHKTVPSKHLSTSVLTSENSVDSQCRWHEFIDERTLQQAAVDIILSSAAEAIVERGQFLLVLAGGNTPRAVYQQLRSVHTDWTSWQIYFGDERCLPPTDSTRNSCMAADVWLSRVGIPSNQIYVIPAELGASQAAKIYTETLRTVGIFDLVLLGLGEDGHTASLFPNQDWGILPNSPDTLAVLDAPKPPPQRVTLSAARLSRARQVVFLISGESKRKAVVQWLNGEVIPAVSIKPLMGVEILVESALLQSLKVGTKN